MAKDPEYVRKYRKTVFFSAKELSAIDQYCKHFGIKSRSAMFRSIIINHILDQANENYPKLF